MMLKAFCKRRLGSRAWADSSLEAAIQSVHPGRVKTDQTVWHAIVLLYEGLSALLGRKINYVDVPPSAAEEGMRKAGMPEWNVRALSDLYSVFASGAAATVTDTASRFAG